MAGTDLAAHAVVGLADIVRPVSYTHLICMSQLKQTVLSMYQNCLLLSLYKSVKMGYTVTVRLNRQSYERNLANDRI